MANLKAKLDAAINKGKSMSSGKGDPVKDLKEVTPKPKNYFSGPGAKLKAKKAIRKGGSEIEIATAKKKNIITGREKTFVYKDRNPSIEFNGKMTPGSNNPYLAKKIVKTKKEQKREDFDKIINQIK
jgi:hypothetical protein